MARCRIQNIDSKAFAAWFETTGMTPTEFDNSVACKGFVSNVAARGYVSLLAYKVMLFTYKLPEGSFIPADEATEEATPAEEITETNESIELLRSINNTLIELVNMLK